MKTSQIDVKNLVNSEIYMVIQDMSFNACVMDDKIFSGSLLKNNSFINVTFKNCVFFACDLEKIEFAGCKFINCQFQFVNSRSCNFNSCDFENCVWVHGSTLYNQLSNCNVDAQTKTYFSRGNNKLHQCFSPNVVEPVIA